jgi:hypothetical protein
MSDDFFDIDVDEFAMSMGFGEEVGLTEAEQQKAQLEADDLANVAIREEEREPVMVPIFNRGQNNMNNQKGFYDPFMQYVKEVSLGKRELGDESGIDWDKPEEKF